MLDEGSITPKVDHCLIVHECLENSAQLAVDCETDNPETSLRVLDGTSKHIGWKDGPKKCKLAPLELQAVHDTLHYTPTETVHVPVA